MGNSTYAFQLIIDEASGYGAANFLYKYEVAPGTGRNATSEEVISALSPGWVQYFGFPRTIKLDKEGARRGKLFEDWAQGHGIEVAVPAEAHGQIGQVERLVGTLKKKVLSHLRSSAEPPEVAIWAMMMAHNRMTDVGGYSPAQWVFGRNMTDSLRLHDGPDLPYWSGMANSERMQRQLTCRLEAETHHREHVMQEKLNQAFNTKMTKPVRFDPGALVFYKRYQPPADRKSHQDLDVPRRKVARWYGPARVLCLETRMTYQGQIRQPYNIAWIISAGRLKLRHASERERLIAEGSMTPSSMPWTFADLTGTINKGEFDDEIMSEKELRAEAKRQRIMQEERQRAEQGQLKRSLEETDLQPTGQAQSSAARPRLTQAAEVPIETDEGDIADDEEMDPRHRVQQDLNVDDFLHDQGVQPFGEPDPAPLYRHPLFLQARQRHERAERPHQGDSQGNAWCSCHRRQDLV